MESGGLILEFNSEYGIDIDEIQSQQNKAFNRKLKEKAIKSKSIFERNLTISEKLEKLRSEAESYFIKDDIKPTERIIHLRSYARKINLSIRDDELRKHIWNARKRSKGEASYFTCDDEVKIEEDNFLWENIILKNDNNLLTAKPKVGKTTLIIEMIGRWAKGEREFLGKKLIGSCPDIIIIGTDMPNNRWYKLLAKFGLAFINKNNKYQLNKKIKALFTLQRPLHLDEQGLEIISELTCKFPECLILLDCYQKCLPRGIQENSNQFSEPLEDFQEVTAVNKTTNIIIHHSGHRNSSSAIDSSRGHTSLPAAVSQCLDMKFLKYEEYSHDKRILLSGEGRSKSIKILIEQKDNGFELKGSYEAIIAKENLIKKLNNCTERQKEVYEFVNEYSINQTPISYKNVAPIIKGAEDKNRQARRTLEQLVNLKLLKVQKKENGNFYWIN